MKFDFVIGNPPYQDEQNQKEESENKRNFAPPVYNIFLDEAYKIAECVEMIHPARFLFNAGSTPKTWNEKMLQDEHIKIPFYEQDSDKVFPGLSTPIKGGIAISYRNSSKVYGPITAFTQFVELNTIIHKICARNDFMSLTEIVYSRTSYRFTDIMHKENPDALYKLSDGHAYDMSSNIFTRLPMVFFDVQPQDNKKYIRILGREDNKRIYKYIRRDYINNVDNFDYYKVFVPQAGGSGTFGDTIGQPIVEGAEVGATETFISIGKFENRECAEYLVKYIKSKFARALLSVLKVTQNGNKPVWRMIPLQDFSDKSDINWQVTISEIDQQLYKKYGLSKEEIDFIEANVKEME